MVDVSKTVVVGDTVLVPRDDVIQVRIKDFVAWWLTNSQAKELASALQLWIERTAEVEE